MTGPVDILEGLMNSVCTDLVGMYPSAQQSSEHGLIFPTKRDGAVRVSEQEAKLLFMQLPRVASRPSIYGNAVLTPPTLRLPQYV